MILKKLGISSKFNSENTVDPLHIVLDNLANVEKQEMGKNTYLEGGKKGRWICRWYSCLVGNTEPTTKVPKTKRMHQDGWI